MVFRTARRLHQALSGQPLVRADLRWGELDGSPLVGRQTLEVVPRGKHLLHRVAGGWTLHTHLRMEGSWRILATDDVDARVLRNPQVRVIVGTALWTALGLRLGMVDLIPTSRESGVVGHLGPDILSPDFDAATIAMTLQQEPQRPIGAALLDQRNVAGIGTLYSAESLFLERLGPWTPVGELSVDQLHALVARARRLMRANLTDAVQSTTGSRRHGAATYVHGRSGLPCRRCGALIRVSAIGQPPLDRPMFYCPACQGGLGPHDDGRFQRPLGAKF